MISIEINGYPVTNASPRLGRHGHTYNPRYKEMDFYKWQIKSQYKEPPLCGPVKVTATFVLPVPKSASKIRRKQMLSGTMHHIKRPDTSNFYYFLENALKEIVFEDDSQVVEIVAKKVYGETPRTQVIVEKINL